MGPFIIHKERFLAVGTHFFRAGGLWGPLQKIYIFLWVLKFLGGISKHTLLQKVGSTNQYCQFQTEDSKKKIMLCGKDDISLF